MDRRIPPLRVAFLHPELVIGGAERLILDAAMCLGELGHRTTIFTTHLDPERSFPEARDGTVDVRVHDSVIPPRILQRLRAPLAIARMRRLAVACSSRLRRYDAIVCDQVAQVIPTLERRTRLPVVFYCHYPDQLTAPPRQGLFKLYRWPIDRLEERATGRADALLVNSRFTARALEQTSPRLRARPTVLYPGVDVDLYARLPEMRPTPPFRFLSISRFDPQKNVPLAVEAFARMRAELPPRTFSGCRLVLAGGCDERLEGHRQTVRRLSARIRELDLEAQTRLVLSPPDQERLELLRRAFAVVHTHEAEHFGYVPVEAMAAGRPVVAVDHAGPAETVVDGETGHLCEPTPEAFAAAMSSLVRRPQAAGRLGIQGRERARRFSRSAFGRGLEGVLWRVVDRTGLSSAAAP